MAVNIIKRLERYFITVVEDASATRRERADAARQLTQLKLLKGTAPKSKPTAPNTVLGSKARE